MNEDLSDDSKGSCNMADFHTRKSIIMILLCTTNADVLTRAENASDETKTEDDIIQASRVKNC